MSERESIDKTQAAMIARRAETPSTEAGNASGSGVSVARDAVDGVSCRAGDASCANAHAGAISRSMKVDAPTAQRSVLRLQMRYGNQYVGRVIDRAASGEVPATDMGSIERSIESSRGGGHGMDHSTRTRMETAFGADFSGVRVHHDAHSDELSRSLSARAFTTGRDVYFRQGEYSPGTSGGRELLAHELTHVVQQTGGIQRKMTVSQPGEPHEVEADRMAQAVMKQEQAGVLDRRIDLAEEDKDKDKHLAAKADDHALMRQPEAPKPSDEEEKKKMHAKLDPSMLSRQREDEPE